MVKYLWFFLLSVTAALALWSCEDSSTDLIKGPPREISMTVTGTLANWNSGDGYSIMAVAQVPSLNDSRKEGIDTASISGSGEFTITLHSIYDKYCYDAVLVNDPGCIMNVNPSPYNMRQANINFEIYQGGTYKGHITNIVHRIGNDTNGTYFLKFTAFSSVGTITGNKLCVNNDSTHFWFYDYYLNTRADWTKIVILIEGTNKLKTLYNYSNNDPQYGVIWEYAMN